MSGNTMKFSYKKLFFEMTLIVLLAVAIGITWNFRLLRAAYTGKLTATTPAPVISATPTVLIPAGLAQVKELYDKKEAVFVDARESSVYSQGHIKGATSLPLGTLDSALQGFTGKVPYKTDLVIYCNGYGCHDSKDLGNKLLQKGYRQILIFEGGYPEWKDAGFPIEGANQ
jgi:rhodanese-related sulfurtransferase